MEKQYDPRDAQKRWLPFWNEGGFFHSTPDPIKKPYTIVIPPPNVTGALHLGHALNNTLQDVLIRWRRMQGYNTLWMPGTDHAGIATQAVVERRLREEESKNRHDLGREELVRRIWKWKDQYEARILGQLRELGCSCDWARTRFTLDETCARAVRETFFRMFRAGLIYRGKRLVNWDTHLQTAVADDEINDVEQTAQFYYLRYPLTGIKHQSGFDHVIIATTRPETMLADTAVAVHPEPRKELDKREHDLKSKLEKASEKEKKEIEDRLARLQERRDSMLPMLEHLADLAHKKAGLVLPLVGRHIPLIADFYADPEKGTGAVKITPAHDFNDFQVGERHPEIGPSINMLNSDGTINRHGQGDFAGRSFSYVGLDRLDARKLIVKDLEELELVEKIEEIKNTIPLSDRSKTPIEPYLSDQWFVKMEDLAQSALDAVTDGHVKFHPERYAKSYLDWLGEKRDWCISRQLWWGHRIPVWRKRREPGQTLIDESLVPYMYMPKAAESGKWSGHILKPEIQDFAFDITRTYTDEKGRDHLELLVCVSHGHEDFERVLEAAGFEQDNDVLDTWFSSALWPHSTLGWPEKTPELDYYYPTSVLVTSRDIITLWVARMVMTGLFNLGKIPFHHVYIHPKILDGFGETMSKSKGNGIDPLDIIERYGTDALRYLMVFISTETQDFRMPVANVCPHCDALVPVKQEHMYMRTRKIACASCKKPFRPGGPWPSDDTELPTAKQASEKFEIGRNFANKLWNAARFLTMNLEGYTPGELKLDNLPLEDRWILSRVATTVQQVTAELEAYHFSDVARIIYDFTWSEFCDWYVEMSKGRLRDESQRLTAQRMLVGVLDTILRLVHPIMPFVAESIWQALNEQVPERGLLKPLPPAASISVAPWPGSPHDWMDRAMEERIARMQDLVRAVREVRNQYMIDPKTELDVTVRANPDIAKDFDSLRPFVSLLAGVGKLSCGPEVTKPAQSRSFVTAHFQAYVSLQGLINVPEEIKRLEKQLAEKNKHLQGVVAKLSNASFTDRAPAEVVQQQRDLQRELEQQIALMEEMLRDLQQG